MHDCCVKRYQVRLESGVTARIETNSYGVVTFATAPCYCYLGEWIPVVRDCLVAQHATLTPLEFGAKHD